MVQGCACWVCASRDVLSVFIGSATAGAFVLHPFVPSCLISVAAIEVRDVPCDPALEGLWEFTHHLADAVPVDVVKGGAENFIASTEKSFGLVRTPVFVDGCLDGRSDFSVADCGGDVFEGEGWVNKIPFCNGVNKFELCKFITSDIQLLRKR